MTGIVTARASASVIGNVEALQNAVAGDVRVDDRRDARVLEAPAEFLCGERRGLRPALDRHQPVLGVDANRDLAGMEARRLAHESRDRAPPPCR